MITNPSKEWTPLERLAVIAEITAYILNKQRILDPISQAEVLDTINVVASKPAHVLEENRRKILTLPPSS